MQPHMVIVLPELTGYGSIRRIAVSLPLVHELLDGKKYLMPGDVKPADGATERRRQGAPRAPSLRALVRWAVKCDSAEQLGERLKRRYDRQRQRQGLAPADRSHAEAKLAETLDRMLAQG
jgi:hypothetical protein